jgi:hypothetical protein
VEPVNHWRPVTLEYQIEFMPAVEALPAPKRKRARLVLAKGAAQSEAEMPLPVTAIQWYYFLRACVYFVLGSVLLSYPASQTASWLLEHASIVAPVQLHATQVAPLINLLAESFFVLSIASAVVGVMWLLRSRTVRWVTLCFAGASLARTVLYFVALGEVVPRVLLSMHQKELLLTGAVINLLIFGYVAFLPGVDDGIEQAA